MYYTNPQDVITANGISLFFQSNRLEVIAVSGKRCRDLIFDNGMTGMMGRDEIVQLLGLPVQRAPKARVFNGSLVFVDRNIRADFGFRQERARNEVATHEALFAIAIRFTDGVTIERIGEPNGPANRSQPVQLRTNSTPLPAGSGR